jgi:hypothetical protein
MVLTLLERLTIAYLTGWLVQHGVSREQAVVIVQPQPHKNAPDGGGDTDKSKQDDNTSC